MTGLNRTTGASLDPSSDAHLAQSIGDILTTPIGSRVMRRTYGSELPDLIDQPVNPLFRIRVFAAVAAALMAWEPRLLLRRITLTADAEGAVAIGVHGERVDLTRSPAVSLSIPLRA